MSTDEPAEAFTASFADGLTPRVILASLPGPTVPAWNEVHP